ncbi:MAG: helix-turn-helix domain-containing protein [Pseudomonadota bacterium]
MLHRLGERLRLLRMRQRLSAKQMAAAAGMSVMTLRSLERGGSGVTMGAYLAVLGVLGIERDVEALAAAAFTGADLAAAGSPSPGPDAGGAAEPAAVTTGAAPGTAAPPSTGTAAAVTAGGATAQAPVAGPAPTAAADVSPQEAFEWLDAPALDLQRLIRPPSADSAPEPARGPAADLFGAPAAEPRADGPREEPAR